MGLKAKEILTYVGTVIINLLFSYLFTLIFFKDRIDNFILVSCSVILLSLLITSIIANKMNYKLDIFAYNIEDIKYLILNSVFIGDLFSIPLAVFLSSML